MGVETTNLSEAESATRASNYSYFGHTLELGLGMLRSTILNTNCKFRTRPWERRAPVITDGHARGQGPIMLREYAFAHENDTKEAKRIIKEMRESVQNK